MIDKVFSVLPNVLLAISSVCFLVSSFIQYLSCDSCKAKRLLKLQKLQNKIFNKEVDENE